jgi:hypothetical protein
MQFEANNYDEYVRVVNEVLCANIYNEIALYYAFDINFEGEIAKQPKKYPCIVSIELEETETDNRFYNFMATKFIYKDELLDAKDYIKNLKKLQRLDTYLVDLNKQLLNAGVMTKPFDEIERVQKEIEDLEKLLF